MKGMRGMRGMKAIEETEKGRRLNVSDEQHLVLKPVL